MGFWANGHLMRAIRGKKGNQLMVFCGKCGRYASGKGDKLNQLCPGLPTRKATLTRLLEGRHPEKVHLLGEVCQLSVARTSVEWHEGTAGLKEGDEARASSVGTQGRAKDPMHELEELEKALEQYQAEGEEGLGERDWANDGDWEMLSSGSE